MKHTLPWNVTGIPPEAREVVRAAAHREGITVGEWLTRRILTQQPKPEEDRAPVEAPLPARPRTSRETEPRRPREEVRFDQSDDLFHRIDEALHHLAHRLESGERMQREAQHAMSAAASEINAATRDQAKAFQHITSRIDKVERQSDTTGLRDAVRGLHQGLSRVAEQIAKTAAESAGQITTLSTNLETLAGKIAAAREESDRLAQSFEEKLAALAERVKQTEEERIATVRELTGRIERTEERFEQRLKDTEANIGNGSRHLDETVAKLAVRMSAAEERLEESLGRHLAGIERALETINCRLERAEARGDTDPAAQEGLRNLTARMTSAEKKTDESLSEIESQLLDTVKRIAAMEAAIPRHGPAPSELSLAIEAAQAESFADALVHAPAPVSKSASTDPFGSTANFSVPANDRQEPVPSPAENYLAQARRAARAAAQPDNNVSNRSRPMRAPSQGANSTGKGGARRLAAAAGFIILIGVGYSAVRLQSNLTWLLQADTPTPAEASPAGTSAQNDTASLGSPPNSAPPAATLPTSQPHIGAPASATRTASAVPGSAATPALASAASGLASLLAQANSGDMRAATSLGLKYADGDGTSVNQGEAARWLSKAANAGEAVAAYRLGTLYERGLGVTLDPKQAMHWYAEAAKQGNRRAMHNLAVAYADGAGGEKNFAEAARWFKAAAELGLTDSQFNVAVLYERGLGVKRSLNEAYKWYAIAAASGDAESKARIAALANQLKPAERDAAEKAAKAYKPEPANIAANES